MVRMNICGLLWLSERRDRDEMRDASRGDGLCSTERDTSTLSIIKMDDVMRARITSSARRRTTPCPLRTSRQKLKRAVRLLTEPAGDTEAVH